MKSAGRIRLAVRLMLGVSCFMCCDPGEEGGSTVPQPGTCWPGNIVDNASFESGWDGFTSWSGGTPANVTRTTEQAFDGSYSVRFTYPINPNNDVRGELARVGTGHEEYWVRWHFYMTAVPNTVAWKFMRTRVHWETLLGGVIIAGGGIRFGFGREANATLHDIGAPPLSTVLNQWNTIEVHYRRNGDATPNAAFWFNGNRVSHPDGPSSYGVYWSNGRMYAGERNASELISNIFFLGTFNRGNSVNGAVYVDRISISTRGKICN